MKNDNLIVAGTCDGTGAAINVCLGFIPSMVVVWNMEDAGNLEPKVEWHREMQFVTQMAEGIKTLGIADTAFDRIVLADGDGGIDEYAGGDKLTYDGTTDNRWETSAGADASEAYVNGNYRREAGSDDAYENYGDHIIGANPRDGASITTAPGFTIGDDSDLNVDGEQLAWIAYR